MMEYNMLWNIIAPVGNVITYHHVTHSVIHGVLTMYDGPARYHELRSVTLGTREEIMRLNISTQFFRSLLHIELFGLDHEQGLYGMLIIGFSYRSIYMHVAKMNSKTTIFSNNYPHQSMVVISTGTDDRATVSMTIRKFHGLNDGGCNMGGYLMNQAVVVGAILAKAKIKPKIETTFYEYGPYCHDASTNEPLLSDRGAKYIVLGQETTLFKFYAYGPLYNIDIDLHVHSSYCGGFLNPWISCDMVLAGRQRKSTIHRKSCIIDCLTLARNRLYQYGIKLYMRKPCFHLQQLASPRARGVGYYLTVRNYETYRSVAISLSLSFSSPYHYAHFPNQSSFHTLTTRLNMMDLHSRVLQMNESSSSHFDKIMSAQFAYKSKTHVHSLSYDARLSLTMVSYSCANIKQEHFKQTPFQNIFLMKILSSCGYMTHSVTGVYFYMLQPERHIILKKWAILYISIDREICHNEPNLDIITFVLHGRFAISMNFTITKFEVQSFDSQMKLLYEKVDSLPCSTVNVLFTFDKFDLFHNTFMNPFPVGYLGYLQHNFLKYNKVYRHMTLIKKNNR